MGSPPWAGAVSPWGDPNDSDLMGGMQEYAAVSFRVLPEHFAAHAGLSHHGHEPFTYYVIFITIKIVGGTAVLQKMEVHPSVERHRDEKEVENGLVKCTALQVFCSTRAYIYSLLSACHDSTLLVMITLEIWCSFLCPQVRHLFILSARISQQCDACLKKSIIDT